VPCFVIHHRHLPGECGIAFNAFRGHDTVLRRRPALAGCSYDEHAIWWIVEAADRQQALALLPFFVAQRATVTRVADVVLP
jgi:hypothetical protein